MVICGVVHWPQAYFCLALTWTLRVCRDMYITPSNGYDILALSYFKWLLCTLPEQDRHAVTGLVSSSFLSCHFGAFHGNFAHGRHFSYYHM
jgi:hypothetical protein